MAYASTYLLIGSLYLLAARSPGPNFFIISQLALHGDRATALRVTAGIVMARRSGSAPPRPGLPRCCCTTARSPPCCAWPCRLPRLVCSRLLRRALRPAPPVAPAAATPAPNLHNSQAGLRTGLLTSFTNPKAAAFWTSVFASTLPVGAPLGFYVGVCLLITLLSALWHLGIALVFSRPALQAGYARARRPIEAFSGASLVVMGLRQALAR